LSGKFDIQIVSGFYALFQSAVLGCSCGQILLDRVDNQIVLGYRGLL
jgi:hypothetical protein